MNILEAIEAAKNGYAIKYEDDCERLSYFIQTTYFPLNIKEFKEINYEDAIEASEFPKELSDLEISALKSICIDAILHEQFRSITIDEMFKEIQKGWKENHLHRDDEEDEL
jgi:hypothetical protein